MTLQALEVDLAHSQQTCIRGSMWRVATATSFCFYGHVLVDERTSFICVASDAGCVSVGHHLHLPKSCGSMDVMTIGAANQTFIYTMMKGLEKIGFGSGMASVAKLRLLFDQQIFGLFSVVRRMTI